MRKFVSIFLICLLLLNALGFYGLLSAIHYHHYQALKETFDAGAYREQETMLLEVPHSIPYVAEQEEFQRVDGEIKYKGEFYKLVKQRISIDSIHLVVLKDKMRKRTHQALEEYNKTLSEQSSSGEEPAGKASYNFYKEYFGSSFSISTISYGWIQKLPVGSPALKQFLAVYTSSVFTPPELV